MGLFSAQKLCKFSIFCHVMNEVSPLKILISNDDGVSSELMLKLARELSKICDVTVSAPDSQKSGISHAFSGACGLKVTRVEGENFPVYAVSGMPVDAVKFAICERLCGGSMPDFVISGVNPGENSGISSIYSGTVGAAREGALWGIPAMALSLRGTSTAHLDTAIAFAKKVVAERLFVGMSKDTFWNVNFPKPDVKYRGVVATNMTVKMFSDHYEVRDGLYYLEGDKDFEGSPLNSDDRMLAEGYAVLTPHKLDQTSASELDRLKSFNFNEKGEMDIG